MKTKVNVFFLLTCLSLLSCKDEYKNSKIVDFKAFQLEVPSNWKKFSGVGYDAKVGGLTDGKYTLHYDWFSYNFNSDTTATHIRIETENGSQGCIDCSA